MEINKIYNENCLETMARMEDNYIDLTVTSKQTTDYLLTKELKMKFDFYYYDRAESELKKKIEVMSGGKESYYYLNSMFCLNDMRKEIIEFEEKVNDKLNEFDGNERIIKKEIL